MVVCETYGCQNKMLATVIVGPTFFVLECVGVTKI